MRERKDNKKSDGPGAVADKFDDVYHNGTQASLHLCMEQVRQACKGVF